MSSNVARDYVMWPPDEPDGPHILVMAVFDGDVPEVTRYGFEFGRRWWPAKQEFRPLADRLWKGLRLRQWFEAHPETRSSAPPDDDLIVPPELMRYTVTLADGTPVDLDAPRFQYGDVRRVTVYFHEEAIR